MGDRQPQPGDEVLHAALDYLEGLRDAPPALLARHDVSPADQAETQELLRLLAAHWGCRAADPDGHIRARRQRLLAGLGPPAVAQGERPR